MFTWVLLGIGAGIFLATGATYQLRQWSRETSIERALRGVTRTPIAQVAAGTEAKIAGRVVAIDTVRAPISGRACVAWAIDDENRSSNNRDGGVPFLVDDGTGRAYVHPTGAEIVISAVRVRAQLEGVLAVGALVSVSGLAVHEPDPDPSAAGQGYRDGPAMRLRFSQSTDHPLRISDLRETTR